MHPNKNNILQLHVGYRTYYGLWPKLLWLHQSITHIGLQSKPSISEHISSDICTLKTASDYSRHGSEQWRRSVCNIGGGACSRPEGPILTSTSIRFHT